jgi:hypothetical protein
MVTATIDGQVVSWLNNWHPDSTTAPAPIQPVAIASQVMVTATIDGQVVSWVNDWHPGVSTSVPATTLATQIHATSQAAPETAACPGSFLALLVR